MDILYSDKNISVCVKPVGLDSEAEVPDALREQLGGEVAPTGQYPVIFNTDAMCSLLGVYSGIFNSEAAQKGLSKLAGKEGELVASENVTLVDDPFYPEKFGHCPFDGEGVAVYTKNVIENGRLEYKDSR